MSKSPKYHELDAIRNEAINLVVKELLNVMEDINCTIHSEDTELEPLIAELSEDVARIGATVAKLQAVIKDKQNGSAGQINRNIK